MAWVSEVLIVKVSEKENASEKENYVQETEKETYVQEIPYQAPS
jgi:hypothetical protein